MCSSEMPRNDALGHNVSKVSDSLAVKSDAPFVLR
jgi:hypothetical protein